MSSTPLEVGAGCQRRGRRHRFVGAARIRPAARRTRAAGGGAHHGMAVVGQRGPGVDGDRLDGGRERAGPAVGQVPPGLVPAAFVVGSGSPPPRSPGTDGRRLDRCRSPARWQPVSASCRGSRCCRSRADGRARGVGAGAPVPWVRGLAEPIGHLATLAPVAMLGWAGMGTSTATPSRVARRSSRRTASRPGPQASPAAPPVRCAGRRWVGKVVDSSTWP